MDDRGKRRERLSNSHGIAEVTGVSRSIRPAARSPRLLQSGWSIAGWLPGVLDSHIAHKKEEAECRGLPSEGANNPASIPAPGPDSHSCSSGLSGSREPIITSCPRLQNPAARRRPTSPVPRTPTRVCASRPAMSAPLRRTLLAAHPLTILGAVDSSRRRPSPIGVARSRRAPQSAPAPQRLSSNAAAIEMPADARHGVPARTFGITAIHLAPPATASCVRRYRSTPERQRGQQPLAAHGTR
jgi:hypothetical protein